MAIYLTDLKFVKYTFFVIKYNISMPKENDNNFFLDIKF